MKKIVMMSGLTISLLMGASDLSSKYPYEVGIFGAGIAKEEALKKNYANGGVSIAKNFQDSFIDQVELSYLRSDNVKYKNSEKRTHVNRTFLNIIKKFDISEQSAIYALVGAGYQDVSEHELKDHNEDSPVLNYGVGIRHDIPYYGIALKADVRHLYATKEKDNNLMYTFGLAMPLGTVENNIKVPVPKVRQIKTAALPQKAAPRDDDNDGVINELDKCPGTSPGVKVNKDGCVVTVKLRINFAFDSARIKGSYNNDLEKFATMLKERPNLTALIEGHTDSVGTEGYNQGLSERRAASAVRALENLGVNSSRLNSVGYGESQPIASNKTRKGRAKNRRVIGYGNK